MAKIIIFTGAGISAESGISTFRDSNGIWENNKIEDVCNFDSLQKNRSKTISFYDQRRMDLADKKPNYCHEVIAKLKTKYPDDIAIITQNIDDLFEKANIPNTDILYLHGFLRYLRCEDPKCGSLYDIGYSKQQDLGDVRCVKCFNKLRPHVVFFKEPVPQYSYLNRELADCQMLIVIGTSGKVIPLNNLAEHIPYVVLNNLESSPYIREDLFDKVYLKKATEAIDEIEILIESFLNN